MTKKIEFLLFVLLLTACVSGNKKINDSGSNEKSSITDIDKKKCFIIDVDNAEERDTLCLSKLFKPVKTIVLETKKECKIGCVDKMYADDNNIVILDAYKTKSIFVFDLYGKYLRKIGNIGNGPGEYYRPKDFTVDSKHEQIYVLDSWNKGILIYNLNNGKYIKKIIPETDSQLHYIQYVGGKIYADAYSSQSDNQYLLQEFDLNGSLVNRFINNTECAKGHNNSCITSEQAFTYVSNDKSFFHERYMDTVISIENNMVFPYLTLKSKDSLTCEDVYNLSSSNNPQKAPGTMATIMQTGKILGITNCLECNDYIYVSYFKGYEMKHVLYHKQSNAVVKIKTLKDDLVRTDKKDVTVGNIFKFGCSSTHGIYKYVDLSRPKNLEDLKGMANYDFLIPTLDKLDMLKTLPDDSNPILFYYEYK